MVRVKNIGYGENNHCKSHKIITLALVLRPTYNHSHGIYNKIHVKSILSIYPKHMEQKQYKTCTAYFIKALGNFEDMALQHYYPKVECMIFLLLKYAENIQLKLLYQMKQ